MAIFRGTGGQGDSTTDTTVTTVTEKAAEAASSATSAANSATSASNSATSAETSATNAATSESNAATSASNASTSATAAETAKTAAQAAQTAAETAETNAETAEANAVTAKTQAESARDNAQTAQTAAETAETNAETAYSNTLAIYGSTTDVQNAVDSASASATTATTKASEAATSATNAANSATSAGTSETNAASSASSAATSAASANSYATDAQTAQTAAETAQAAAEASEAEIKGLYLGSLADDPTLDGNGVAVTTGDLYFNTTEQEVRVYTDGDVWEPIQELSGDQTVNSLTSNNDVVVKGNLEVQGTTITVDSATAQTIDLGDNDKIRLGDDDDLQVYHDGTDSYIANSTGTLKLSGNTDITGNITVSGTVDGRDVAADGATLDAVASTYVDVSGDTLTGDLAFGDNVKAKFGDDSELEIYHDGTKSIIRDIGTGNLQIRGANFQVTNAAGTENMILALPNGSVSLYYDNSQKLATTSSGVDVTGTLVSDGLTVDGDVTLTNSTSGNHLVYIDSTTGNSRLVFSRDGTDRWNIGYSTSGAVFNIYDSVAGATRLAVEDNGDILFYEDTGTTAKLTWDASAEHLKFSDSVEARFGDNSEFRIYHDTSDTYLVNFTQGNIYLKQEVNDKDVVIQSDDGSGGSTNYFVADGSTGEAKLFHYGSEKLKSQSTGIDVTGTVTADGLTIEGSAGPLINLYRSDVNALFGAIQFKDTTNTNENARIGWAANELRLQGTDKVSLITDEKTRLFLASTGDISFYNDSGTSQDFYWDASTSRLGLGTTSPQAPLEVFSSTSTAWDATDDDGQRGTNPSTIAITNHDGSTNSFAQIVFDTASSGQAVARIAAIRSGFASSDLAFTTEHIDTKAERLRITSDGKVGIGTTSPSGNLDITTSSLVSLDIQGGDGNSKNIIFRKTTGGIQQAKISAVGDDLRFTTGTTSERMRIDSSGRLGIGTTSPSEVLTVASSTRPRISITDTTNAKSSMDSLLEFDGTDGRGGYLAHISGDLRIYNDLSGQNIQFGTVGTERMRIDSSGRLGIGTTSPSTALSISTSSANGIDLQADEGNSTISARLMLSTGTSGQSTLLMNKAGSLAFHTGATVGSSSGSEAARIDSSGNVGIGTASPQETLQIKSPSNGDGLRIQRDSTTANDYAQLSFLTSTADTFTPQSWIRSFRQANPDHSVLTFGANNTERMRIDSSGNVGIGTTDPNTTLHVKHNGGGLRLQGESSDLYGAYLDFAKEAGTRRGLLGYTGSGTSLTIQNDESGDIRFNNNGSEAMRLDSSGRLGIGTTSPSEVLELRGSTNAQIRMQPSATGESGFINTTSGSTKGMVQYNHNSNFMRIYTNGSEAMRIDSSGNLLVGKTSSAESTDGAELRSSGFSTFTRNNNNVMVINRRTSDGDIVKFKKDGTTVGSIGVDTSDIVIDGSSLHSGLRFFATNISPRYNLASSDNGIDLGASTRRFKNLYLSGGVYLGGTATANRLNDYEEGTWTPSLDGTVTSPTVTYTTQDGYYVKTGKQVFVHARITINTYSGGSSSGLIRLNGLPFTSSSPSYSVLSVSRIGDWALDISTYTGPQWIVLSNLTSCYLYSVSNSTGSQDALAPDIFGNGSTFTFSGTYEAA